MADPSRRLTSPLSYISDSSTAAGSAPSSPLRRRPGYERITSGALEDIAADDEGQEIEQTFGRDALASGLGIGTGTSPKPPSDRRVSITRVPVGAKASTSSVGSPTPGSSQPLMSPLPDIITPYDPNAPYDAPDPNRKHSLKPSVSSFHSSVPDNDFGGSDTVPLNKQPAVSIRSTKTARSAYDNDYNPSNGCPSSKEFYQSGLHWLSVCVYALSIFSTVGSGIFLIIALIAPRWGHAIRSTGGLSPGTANVLVQLFAKLTELAFVACFVTFLGQVLSRRAVSQARNGVMLAEMNMRSWIMQPGTLLTHYQTLRFAALTFLGALSLTAAIVAMLYTTAAQALGRIAILSIKSQQLTRPVTPQLKFSHWENHTMYGLVKTSFANPNYIESNCQNPIQVSTWDPEYSATDVGTTCVSIDYAAQGLHNFKTYLSYWADVVANGNGTINQQYRPQGFGLFMENTTANASWIEMIDTNATSHKFGRIVNNVTMAFPHSGIYQAARDPQTNLVQPEDLDGVGIYNIRAAIPSPYINVLCANMNGSELAPLIYANQSNVTLNYTQDLPTNWLTNFNFTGFANLTTAVDDVFGFDENNRPPIFYKFPQPFNTILNNTGIWPQPNIYLLGLGGPDESTGIPNNDDYFMCRLKAGLTPKCSTHYTATGSGGYMTADCDDPDEPLTYIRFNGSRQETTSSDWFNVATLALDSLALNNGITDGDASLARMLTQFQLHTMGGLNPSLPSPAEALAVMAGCTLLMGAQDSPFVEFWNYSSTTLTPGMVQQFPALIQAQQYASGGTQAYQRVFYVVLLVAFALNAFVLVYIAAHRGLVTDFSEPPNLFAIAVNSPPSARMRGACGGGPAPDQYALRWRVAREKDHLFMAGDERAPFREPPAAGARGFRKSFFRGRATGFAADEDAVEMGGVVAQAAAPYEEVQQHTPQQGPPQGNLGRNFSLLAKRRSYF